LDTLYQYIYAPSIALDSETPERQSFENVLLMERLQTAVGRINPSIPADIREDAIKQIQRLNSPELIANNEAFHRMLTEGIKVGYQKDGYNRGDLVWLVDFANPENNDFLVANQFTVIENNINKRPDVILFVNGLPLVVIELKNLADENANVRSAFKQLQTYKQAIPNLFTYNGLMIISDGLEAKAGSISTGFSRFMVWKTAEESAIGQDCGIPCKLWPAGCKKKQPLGDRKGGVVWHTQGSGKSLSMVFYTGKIVLVMDNPTVLVITDRNDLDDQLFDTFAASKQLLRQEPVQAEDRGHLKELLKVASGGVVFTTIQKFQPDEGNVYETLSARRNIIVIADEAHRTQYGFKAKTIDDKDENGNVVGKKIVYGFAKYLRDALPNATYLGFTGTPIESTDVNTPAVFGNYVDVYDILQVVDNGATVRIYYENRLAKISLSEEVKKLVSDLDDELKVGELTVTQKAKAKWTQLEALIGSEDRIKQVAQDIINHFEQR